jgi:lipoprotein-anchoring transpeptidase ErfK/SrfK
MLARRRFLLALAGLVAGPAAALAHPMKPTFELPPEYLPQDVAYGGDDLPGTIVVETEAKYLYLVNGGGQARRYAIGVGRAGLAWKGTAEVARKARWPSWRPTNNMIKRQPEKYARYADGVPGGPGNPLGSRALYLFREGRDTMYRIHGTTEPWSIGKAVSNGCVRMINEHVEELFDRVEIGTFVNVR